MNVTKIQVCGFPPDEVSYTKIKICGAFTGHSIRVRAISPKEKLEGKTHIKVVNYASIEEDELRNQLEKLNLGVPIEF